MKHVKKLIAAALTLFMALAVAAPAFAQTVAADPADEDNATITIKNPAKGEDYSIFKLFDATVGADGTISYQCEGDIPEALSAFFTKDASNNVIPDDSILVKDDTGKVTGSVMTDGLKTALETWANSATATATVESNGDKEIVFTGLPYGYYVMTTSHIDDEAAKALITVDSTKPNAEIYDKNKSEIEAKEKKIFNAAGEEIESVTIGETVKYVAKFDTTNYVDNGTGTNGAGSKQVVQYEIKDTLPAFMTDVTITSVTVGGTALNPTPSFDANGSFLIDWVDSETGASLYAQGAEIVVTYTAKITSDININATSLNTISIQPYTEPGVPFEEPYEVERETNTYAAAIQKIDENGEPLPGAQFTIKGLVVEETAAGVYTVVSYDSSSDAESAVLDTDENGMLYIVGLSQYVSLTVTEYKAPDGYNKLTAPVTLTPQILSTTIYKESGTYYYDEDGNLTDQTSAATQSEETKNLNELDAEALEIENQSGTQLPSTGGIGTTIFYIIGGTMVVAAGVMLITKRRMAKIEG